MYLIILFLLFSIIIIYIVYQFFPKIDSVIKKYLPSQRVVDIKSEMNSIDNKNSNNDNNDNKINNNYTINDKINNIVFMPIHYLYRIFISSFSQFSVKIP